MALLVGSGLLILANGTWSVAIALDLPGVSDLGLVLISISLWVSTISAVTGMMVARGRWARRLGLAVTGAHAALAVIRPVDGWWTVAIALSAAGAVALAGPWLHGIVRSRPSASGPPARAVLVPLMLVAVPFLLGILGADDVEGATVGFGAVVAAFWFIRALPGALWVVRLVWPILAVALAWPIGGVTAIASLAAGIAVAVLAWDSSVARSVSPLVERGSLVRIPPELTPPEILDAAGIDERGRPR